MTTVVITPEQALRSLNQEYFVKGRKFQRGSGIFSVIGKFLLPIVSSVGKYLLNKGTSFVNETSKNLAQGRSFGESLKHGAASTMDEVNEDVKRKMRGEGVRKGKKKKMGGVSKSEQTSKKKKKKMEGLGMDKKADIRDWMYIN